MKHYKHNKKPIKFERKNTFTNKHKLIAKEGDVVNLEFTYYDPHNIGKQIFVKGVGKVFCINAREQGYYIMFKKPMHWSGSYQIETYDLSSLEKPLRDNPNSKLHNEAYNKAKHYLHYGETNICWIFLYQDCPNLKINVWRNYPFIQTIEDNGSNTWTLDELINLGIVEYGVPQYLPE